MVSKNEGRTSKMKKIFYEKVGSRYKPVSEYDSNLMDSLPQGTHIIMCYPGGKSTHYKIDPALAPMIAAGRLAEGSMHDAIRKAVEMRNNGSTPLTKEQLKAWQRFVDAMGESGRYIHYESVHDIAQAGIKAMIKEANKLLTNPAVKLAYDHFMLVCELTKENNNE